MAATHETTNSTAVFYAHKIYVPYATPETWLGTAKSATTASLWSAFEKKSHKKSVRSEPVAGTFDRMVAYILKRVPQEALDDCAMSHLYMIRWDDRGMPSAYGLKSQEHCTPTGIEDHFRDRKLAWVRKALLRLREAAAIYTEAEPFVPIAQRLANTASLWWADDFYYWPNRLLEGMDSSNCLFRIFVWTANISQPCQVLVPALFEYDMAHDQVYRLRRSAVAAVPWVQRYPQLFYRGTDYAPISCSAFLPKGYRPRRHIMMLSRRYPKAINASIHKDDSIDLLHFAKYRYLADIGGISCTTWSALHWKLSSGSLVFVVQHPGGLTNWWGLKVLQPWVHYVPIKHDYSDIFEKLQYFEHHVEQAIAITARGQRAALEYTQTLAFDILGKILLDSLKGEAPRAIQDYAHDPDTSLWYCAIPQYPYCQFSKPANY